MQTLKFELGGSRYEVFPLTGRRALTLGYRLSKYLSGPVGEAASSAMDGKGGEIDLGAAVGRFFENCSEREFTDFYMDIIEGVTYNGTPLKDQFDVAMQGKPGDMFELLIKVVRYHFEDFFTRLAGSVSAGMSRAAAVRLED